MAKFDSGRFDGTSGSGGGGGSNGGEGSGGTNSLPSGRSQIAHMFSDRPGHLTDTPANHALIEKLVNDNGSYVGTDERGLEWYSQITSDGTQVWASVYHGIVQNCGENETPHVWDPRTGFSYNPFKERNNR